MASAQDVKDASASVLRDLKRFQREKEDDLKRYMVSTQTPTALLGKHRLLTNRSLTRLPMRRATSSGPRRTRKHGRRRARRLLRLMNPKVFSWPGCQS